MKKNIKILTTLLFSLLFLVCTNTTIFAVQNTGDLGLNNSEQQDPVYSITAVCITEDGEEIPMEVETEIRKLNMVSALSSEEGNQNDLYAVTVRASEVKSKSDSETNINPTASATGTIYYQTSLTRKNLVSVQGQWTKGTSDVELSKKTYSYSHYNINSGTKSCSGDSFWENVSEGNFVNDPIELNMNCEVYSSNYGKAYLHLKVTV